MTDYFKEVRVLADNYRSWAAGSLEAKPDVAKRHAKTADALEHVLEELMASRRRLRPLSEDYGDLSDLPEEVFAQLNLSKGDELEQQLRDIVASQNGDEASLDQIIIELFRRHNVVQERRFVMNKLYRMVQKELIQAVDGKKGFYRLPDTSVDDDW